jgi:hypothetical protein
MVAGRRSNQPWERVTEGTRDVRGQVTSGSALFGAVEAIREAAGLSTRGSTLKVVSPTGTTRSRTAPTAQPRSSVFGS